MSLDLNDLNSPHGAERWSNSVSTLAGKFSPVDANRLGFQRSQLTTGSRLGLLFNVQPRSRVQVSRYYAESISVWCESTSSYRKSCWPGTRCRFLAIVGLQLADWNL
jgi:hypothetical protein